MKKILSFFLTLVMVLTLACSVSAAEETKGIITIKNVALKASEDSEVSPLNEYFLYKLLDLESYEDGIYFYTVAEQWESFFTTKEAKKYFTVDNAGYVTAKDGIDNEDMPAFGQLALNYAEDKKNGITADYNNISHAELTPDEGNTTGTLEFSGLDLGYYLVDSTVGTLCALDTTNPSVEIEEKNEVPGLKKEVMEGEIWGESNTAKIGDTVEFKATITVTAGTQNYVLHDEMTEGLTYQGVTGVKLNDEDIVSNNDNDNNYTVNTLCSDGCDFEVSFDQDFVAGLKPGDTIVVYYTAILNGQAKISPDENTNTSRVQYGENNHFNYTPDDTTKTYTYSFDIVKTDAENKLLNGAKFKIYDVETGGNEIEVILDAGKYRPVTSADKSDGGVQADEIVVTDGKVTLVGFDKGIYYLEEIEAPAGYNKLNARQELEIGDKNLGNLSASFTNESNYSAGGFQVINRSGTELPQTGARGTALFITFGMIVVLGAGVLLVTKKRMGMIQE